MGGSARARIWIERGRVKGMVSCSCGPYSHILLLVDKVQGMHAPTVHAVEEWWS